jgi:hypothetical protein
VCLEIYNLKQQIFFGDDNKLFLIQSTVCFRKLLYSFSFKSGNPSFLLKSEKEDLFKSRLRKGKLLYNDLKMRYTSKNILS